ncbi:MAG: hypothetical protein AB1637_00110 [Elusimicrobiota bacterium]
MKLLTLSLLFFYSVSHCYTSPATYEEAKNRIFEASWSASLVQKDLRKNIEEQAANYAVLNQLRQAKIKAEEMRTRENITAAVKVADLGITAAGIVTGGMALAAQGATKEALKWYFVKKIAQEGAKEAAGVPGYSDSVKVGVYIFNKADERDIKASLSKNSNEILLKAQKIFETEGTTIHEKNLALIPLITEMEDEIKKKDYYLQACVKRLDELKKETEMLEKDAAKRKAEEEKKQEEIKKNIKEIPFTPKIETNAVKTTDIPTPAPADKETEEQKRARIQKAINEYIQKLSNKIKNLSDKAQTDFSQITAAPSLSYTAQDSASGFLESADYIKNQLASAETYMIAQSLENSAKAEKEKLTNARTALQKRENDIKNKIEPTIKEIAETVSLWKGTYNSYSPQGYYVPPAPKIEDIRPYNDCYVTPLSWIQTFIKSTEGIEGIFSSLESAAKSRKNSIYSNIKTFASSYLSKFEEFKTFAPQAEKKILSLLEQAGPKSEPINNLYHYFSTEFSYFGKNDLKDLKAKVQDAQNAWPAVSAMYDSAAALYFDLMKKNSEIEDMKQDPMYYEISNIAYSATDSSHKNDMENILKKINTESPRINLGTVEPQAAKDVLLNSIYSAKNGLSWLENAKDRIISVYSKAISAFSSASQTDFSPYYSNAEVLSKKVSELNDIYAKAQLEKDKIMEEARKKSFFGEEEPVLKQTGFWDPEITKKVEEYEKTAASFWASPKGQEIRLYLNKEELRKNNDAKNPDLQIIRNLYQDLKRAYESKNVSAVMSLIDPNWTSPDGEDSSELRQYLESIFKMFNEISFDIRDLNIVSDSKDTYSVSYNLEIRSKIYSKNIKREEKSSVYEKVKVENGKAKIFKTDNGSYWQIK